VNKPEPIVITVLRHGAVTGRSAIFRGASEEELSAQGIAQMQQRLAKNLTQLPDYIASSPIRRCADFALNYAAQHRLPMQLLPCFAELNFGDWQGLTPDEAALHHPEAYSLFQASFGEQPPPNGESLSQFKLRISQGWQHWLAQNLGSHRLLITHAGVMRGLLMTVFNWSPAQAFQIALPDAASLQISHLAGQPPFLLSLN
jgi:alpha-ribazole phosphatase/probable phosphoglycerate mutase